VDGVDQEGSVFQAAFHVQKASLMKIPNCYKTTVVINFICMDCRSLRVPTYTMLKLLWVFPLFPYNLIMCRDPGWRKILK
jgi:hypothetical protein